MSESTGWQDYDWEIDTVRDVPPDKVFDRAVVTPMDGVVDHITSQLAATGTADVDARRVGEAFTSMYDDPQAARASWDATMERAGYITPADTNWAATEAARPGDPVTGDYADLTNAEAYDWPEDLEVAPTPHEWQVDGRAATPAELQDWGARARAGERRPEARPVTLPSEATAQVATAAPIQAAVKVRLTQ
jgi:hypothetical protein